ncbi:hypothetical protein DM860_008707 [Cuscuta australis]|nr:hypothetical protein DM860_008707 [Cuscuta australis]
MGFVASDGSRLKIVDCCLRLAAAVLAAAAVGLAVSDRQANSSYGVLLSFAHLGALRYTVAVGVACGGYALFTAVALWVRSLVSKAWFFFLSDQIIAYVTVTSLGALAEIVYLAYNGDEEVTWMEVCTSYGKFCGRLKLVLALLAIVLCCFLSLAVISAFRVFSRYEYPSVHCDEFEKQVK